MSDSEVITAGPSVPAKRGRGRPKKDPSMSGPKRHSMDGDTIKNGTEDGIAKRRGRKPGTKTATPVVIKKSTGGGSPGKRGRPKGSFGRKRKGAKGKKSPGGTGRGRGRPKSPRKSTAGAGDSEEPEEHDEEMDGSAEDDDE